MTLKRPYLVYQARGIPAMGRMDNGEIASLMRLRGQRNKPVANGTRN